MIVCEKMIECEMTILLKITWLMFRNMSKINQENKYIKRTIYLFNII